MSDSEVETKDLLYADLFSGCGGMSLGFERAGFKCVGAVDQAEHAAETYAENLNQTPITADITDLSAADLRDAFGVDTGDLDVIISCAPCQGFSQHRNKHDDVDEERNSLVSYSTSLSLALEPEFFVMENVPEMIRGSQQHHWRKAHRILKEGGYLVRYDILNAADYGVPQRRKRAIIIARKDGRKASLPTPSTPDDHRTVREAIEDLPALKAGERDDEDPMHQAPDHTDRIIEMLDHIPTDGGTWIDIDEEHQEEFWLDSMKKRVNRGDTSSYIDTYGRMHWDRPAPTITRKSSSPSCGRFVHPIQNRNITPREAARLQTFPDDWMFEGSFTDWYAQNGNAVPPLLAEHIATHIATLYPIREKGARQTTLTGRDWF